MLVRTAAGSRYLRSRADAGPRTYEPSQFEGDFLTPEHAEIAQAVDSVPGKLKPEDHLKLYELAYLARGPILEIGRDSGRSLCVLALAVKDAGSRQPVYSIELSDSRLDETEDALSRLRVRHLVRLVQGDSAEQIGALDMTFDLVFVDGDHSYEGVRRDLLALEGRVAPGGSVLFHDYFDRRNADPDVPQYGVRQAVDELGPRLGLAFRGGYGATAVFEQT